MVPLILILFYSSYGFGATFSLTGLIKDKATDTNLFGAHARIFNAADTSLVAETDALEVILYNGTNEVRRPVFSFWNLDSDKKYLLEVTRQNFDTYFKDIDPATMVGKTGVLDLGTIYLKRSPKVLDELVVRPSKVYFYNKGDTLVYNADAFVLAEGSMLDDLLRQMPGVELKAGGEIYVNGRYVERLLLNGKDFFKGNHEAMLENLGAYTVKNIAVYEGQDEMDKIMGKDYGRKMLSMDVRLKRDYAHGLLTNVEAGYGSRDRYLGRLFAMWFSDNARISAYANLNNLSDKRKPGQDTGFTPAMVQSGDFKTRQGGIDYWAQIPFKGVSFSGDFMASHVTVDDSRSVYTTNFLPAGNTYGYAFTKSRNRFLAISTGHSMEIQKKRWNMSLSPSFKYNRNNDISSLSSAVFDKEWEDVTKSSVDNLYCDGQDGILRSILNRNLNDTKRLGHDIEGNLSLRGKVKMKNDADAISYFGFINYKGNNYEKFQRYRLNFGNNPEYADYSDRYFDNTPDYKISGAASLGYVWAMAKGMFLDAWYQYDAVKTHEVSELYRLENIYGTANSDKPLGYLPSATDYHSALDRDNSFDSRKRDDTHSLHLDYSYSVNGFSISARLPIVYRNRHLHYIRGAVDSRFSRDRFFLGDASVDINWHPALGWIYMRYARKVMAPDMVDMVEFTDALDPLNVRTGNPFLKDTESHYAQFTLSRNTWERRLQQVYELSANFIHNALAYGYNYNSQTGVRTGSMRNVNGNYDLSLYQSVSIYLGAQRNYMITNKINLGYVNSVDLVSENDPNPKRRTVSNPSLRESLELAYSFGKSQVTAFGSLGLSRFSSHSYGFDAFTAKDLNYGVRGIFSLPKGFGISTDFTVFTRRGYSDPALNKTNLVWNARASYSVLKGRLLFMLDGFDILHNLSNVFYSVNAQARTETYTNVLPRYVMFHIQWKFNKSPKKR